MEVNIPVDKIKKLVENYVTDYAQKYTKALEKEYLNLIAKYYEEYTPTSYTHRKGRLKKAYKTYINVEDKYIEFGIRITGKDLGKFWSAWQRGRYISGTRYIDMFLTQEITFHGGDWHGGYGEESPTAIYSAMVEYADELVGKI